MAVSEVNLELLIKLLNMMTSDNDHIALMSARKANEQIKKVGGSWEALLRGKVTVLGNPFAGQPAVQAEQPHTAWKPRTAKTAPPQPAPQPNYQPKPQPKPQPAYQQTYKPPQPGPGYIWDDTQLTWIRRPRPGPNYGWDYTSQDWKYVAPAAPPPVQTAIINWASRGNAWILNSNEKLPAGLPVVTVIRADGRTDSAKVGKFIEEKNGRYYYNTHKTNIRATSDFAI